MCALYVLGLIASILGFGFVGVNSMEMSAPPSEPMVAELSGGTSISGSGSMEVITVFQGDVSITLPRLVASAQQETMDAQLFGTLVEENSCLYVQSDTGDAQYLIVWAADYSPGIGQDSAFVQDESGLIAVSVGQHVYLDGGEIPADVQPDFEAESGLLPIEGCSGPYWLMGTTARPD